MRWILLLGCVLALVGTAWFAVKRGADQSFALGAPQIEQIVDTGAREAIGALGAPAVAVSTDGRNVTLSGYVESEDARNAVLQAAGGGRLLKTLKDELVVLPRVAPYTFGATKDEDGALTLTGHVPNPATETVLLDEARALTAGAPVKSELSLAAGEPEGDWTGMARSGLQALGTLSSGSLSISGLDGVLSGMASAPEEAAKASALVDAAPLGTWATDIQGVVPLADPYGFKVLKTSDGALILDGVAPDDATREALQAAAQALSTAPVAGDVELARGMPSADWPDTVTAGMKALAATDNGLLDVSGAAVTLTAEVQTADDEAALAPLLGDDWAARITVLNPPEVATVTLNAAEDGALTGAGRLPAGMDADAFRDMLPGVTFEAVEDGKEVTSGDWRPAIDGLNIVLPRFRTAEATITGKALALSGVLQRGYNAAGIEASLSTAMGPGWTVALDVRESAPLSDLIISKRGSEISISGVLPGTSDPGDALSAFGDTASGEALSAGGEGDEAEWATALMAASETLVLFDPATGRISDGGVALEGTLLPGYTTGDAENWLAARLPEGWSASMGAVETPATEGDARISLTTGGVEAFRQGFWLPQVNFPVSDQRCRIEADAALAEEKIEFVTGSAEIDQKGRALLNRLAAVAVRCLNSSDLRLEVGGHTDSVGNDSANQSLSEARAQAVVEALVARGVLARTISATGYGESQPIASNDDAEGRARNRRITFGWSVGGN